MSASCHDRGMSICRGWGVFFQSMSKNKRWGQDGPKTHCPHPAFLTSKLQSPSPTPAARLLISQSQQSRSALLRPKILVLAPLKEEIIWSIFFLLKMYSLCLCRNSLGCQLELWTNWKLNIRCANPTLLDCSSVNLPKLFVHKCTNSTF